MTPGLICHINLARGYRGGERQTELLIRELQRLGHKQRLVARQGEPLLQRLEGMANLDCIGLRQPFFPKLAVCKGATLLQVHEAKGGHLACAANSFFGIPYVLTRRVDKPPRNSALNRRLYRNAAAVVAVSAAIKGILQASFVSRPIEVIADAHSDFVVDSVHSEAIRARFADDFVIGHAGALVDRHKGQATLIEALRLIGDSAPHLQLLLMGSGEDEAALRKLAQGMDNVHFEGFTERLGDYMAALDLFAYPSNFEGLGSVLLDAMHAGLPIVASDVGGIPEIVGHEQNGLLVPPGQSREWADAILRLVNDSGLRARLASAAKQRANDYSPAAMARQYLAVYEAIG